MAKEKINEEMQKAFSAKDLEAMDAPHPIDFLSQQGENDFMQDLVCLEEDIRRVCGGWATPNVMRTYPAPMAPGEVMDSWVPVWKLAYKDPSAAVRGRPKTINILETARNFLDTPFQSQKNPISIFMPPEAEIGEEITDFSLRHAVGFTRSLAAKLLCVLALKAALTPADITDLAPFLKAVLYVKVTYETYDNEDALMQKSILAKMIISESTRPDVLQLFYSFSRAVAKQGLPYNEVIDQRINAFNAQTSVDAAKISDAERKMLKLLPLQLGDFLKLLDFHWNQWKASESAVTLRSLVKHLDRTKALDSTVPQVWQLLLKASPEKNYTFLQREITIFLSKVKEASAAARGKPINLSFRAPKLRDASPELGYDMVCLWEHFATDFEKALGPAAYDKACKQFVRGAFDREFTEKVRGLDPQISPDKFRFISVLQGSSTSVKSLALQCREAEEELENARLKAVSVKLAQEQKQWSDFLHTLDVWRSKNTEDRSAFLQEDKENFENSAKQYVQTHFPVYLVMDEHRLATSVQSALNKFSVEQGTYQAGPCSACLHASFLFLPSCPCSGHACGSHETWLSLLEVPGHDSLHHRNLHRLCSKGVVLHRVGPQLCTMGAGVLRKGAGRCCDRDRECAQGD